MSTMNTTDHHTQEPSEMAKIAARVAESLWIFRNSSTASEDEFARHLLAAITEATAEQAKELAEKLKWLTVENDLRKMAHSKLIAVLPEGDCLPADEQITALRAENERLKNKVIDCCVTGTENLDNANKEVEDLRADQRRLEWCAENEVQFGVERGAPGYPDQWIVYQKQFWYRPLGKGDTYTAAIDAAMSNAEGEK